MVLVVVTKKCNSYEECVTSFRLLGLPVFGLLLFKLAPCSICSFAGCAFFAELRSIGTSLQCVAIA